MDGEEGLRQRTEELVGASQDLLKRIRTELDARKAFLESASESQVFTGFCPKFFQFDFCRFRAREGEDSPKD